MKNLPAGTRFLITGGTGSLGQALTYRLLFMRENYQVLILSRDEDKQHTMRQLYNQHHPKLAGRLTFQIGDIKRYDDVHKAMRNVDVVIHAAALKQVPSCEYDPLQATLTNCLGAHNIVEAAQELEPRAVLGISTDKACLPINAMGISKAMQEKIILTGNLTGAKTRFMCCRYGNVIGSRGSVIPMWIEQAKAGLNLSITDPTMTRFLMPIDRAVDTVLETLERGANGNLFIPKIKAATLIDLAEAINKIYSPNPKIPGISLVGIRPGEKMHETLLSENELPHAVNEGNYYIVKSALPETRQHFWTLDYCLDQPYTSNFYLLPFKELVKLLEGTRSPYYLCSPPKLAVKTV